MRNRQEIGTIYKIIRPFLWLYYTVKITYYKIILNDIIFDIYLFFRAVIVLLFLILMVYALYLQGII